MNNNQPKPQRARKQKALAMSQMFIGPLNKNTERNRARKAKKRQSMYNGKSAAVGLPPSVSYTNAVGNKTRNNVLWKTLNRNAVRLSGPGAAFLKAAFAPPDFNATGVTGIPDTFQGNSLMKQHRLVSNFTNRPETDTYILLVPVPGVAYYVFNSPAGLPVPSTAVFQPVGYADYASTFSYSADKTADTLNRFRFLSNHIELVPTVNQMKWAGSITAWKTSLQISVEGVTGSITDGSYTVTGLQAVNASNANSYSGPVFNGLYSGCFNSGPDFEFFQVLENCRRVPRVHTSNDFCQLEGVMDPFGTDASFTGLDNNFETLIVKISNSDPELLNTFLVRSYACVEYNAIPTSGLYEYMTPSPVDALAMELYRTIIKELPVAVTYMDNDSFWKRVLSIIRTISGGLSVMPGPYGTIAGGVNALTTGIEQLLI